MSQDQSLYCTEQDQASIHIIICFLDTGNTRNADMRKFSCKKLVTNNLKHVLSCTRFVNQKSLLLWISVCTRLLWLDVSNQSKVLAFFIQSLVNSERDRSMQGLCIRSVLVTWGSLLAHEMRETQSASQDHGYG